MNQVEYRIAGARRSGIHPLAMWIFEQFHGHLVLLNDVRPGRDPWQNPLNVVVPDDAAPLRKDHPKDCLMLTFEDCPLEGIVRPNLERFVGPSHQVHMVLILRDPFNLLASRLRWARKPGAAAELTNPVVGRRLWLEYAREFLGRTEAAPSAVQVNYNRWVTDPGYRERIGRWLRLAQPRRAMQRVPFFGGGSSFDGRRYDGQARRMRLFDRWREFADDPAFLRLIDHPELLHLQAEIFGREPFAELYQRLRG